MFLHLVIEVLALIRGPRTKDVDDILGVSERQDEYMPVIFVEVFRRWCCPLFAFIAPLEHGPPQ